MIPYSRQQIETEDIEAVIRVLESAWLTTGPAVDSFENAFCRATGSAHAVAVSSGTAALHAAVHAAGIGPGDEVIVPAITFVATANAVVYCGGIPVFAEVEPDTLLIDVDDVEQKITDRTRAIIAVDYAGQTCDYQRLDEIASCHGLILIADACHSVGASHNGKPVGTLADLNCFSFHPVKPMTSAEGGMVTADNISMAQSIRQFRNHGIATSFRERATTGTHAYDMAGLGFNYRMSDLHAALGESQLKRLNEWTRRRNEIASVYDKRLKNCSWAQPLVTRPDNLHSRHLYVVRLTSDVDRDAVHADLRKRGVAANVHYRPVYLNSWYRKNLRIEPGLCPIAEQVWSDIISLPLFPSMTEGEQDHVIQSLHSAVNATGTNAWVNHPNRNVA